MQIFVTGASGFVGGAATRRLVADGHSVSAMSRSAGSDLKIEALGAQPVRCDLEDVTAAHLDSADVVIHAAAFVEPWGPKDAWDRLNVGGTRRMLAAAKAAGVRRFVHIGTEAAIVHGQHVHMADETVPLSLDSPYPYCRTKALAEQAVRQANDPAASFETVVLRPRFIWGPGDQTILPMIKAMAASGQWSWFDHGRAVTSTTHVENLVEAIVLALDSGRGGEAYFILDDGERSMHEMISGMAASVGVALPERSLPGWLGHAIGAVLEGTWRTLRLKGAPPLTRHAAMVMSRDCTLIGDKARREMGYVPRISVEEGLAALRNQG
ncbi:NAD-dependent epimerase/dehydratase family protein [Oleomonas cavernae]|uniref:NAD-dependent epimerase/dehydratase family protein n=1 Tax=Oleomonas cavernae TaxID=2320859 RepID=A0A418VU23_9PROT|nr:NAD-dependent epimerase/dehydratase family protein [Oleomonas cavernae]RJF80636.1 NAD-dependent epimerase/dehydratase family protein [Oleomonas cavernae]